MQLVTEIQEQANGLAMQAILVGDRKSMWMKMRLHSK